MNLSARLPRFLTLLLAVACLAGTSACVHRVDIQQGNFLEAEDVERISVGMTRVQVRSVLGTPMVADPFVSSRWDYLYYHKPGRSNRAERRHFIVHFDGEDKVERIERPTATPPA